MQKSRHLEEAIFAAGCFWGVEHAFAAIEGVEETEVGYTGGHDAHPTYKEVCRGGTGHAEAVRLRFDPSRVSYTELVERFFELHDPTTLNRQGPDVGSQYRSAIFATTEEQLRQAQDARAHLQASGRFRRPIVTQIGMAQPFYRAEEYHQKYFEKSGRSACRTG